MMLLSLAIHRLRICAGLVLVCMIYQMGACPCGCLEHNYWFQALGLAGDHHHHAHRVDHGDGVSINEDDHDCSGDLRPLFLDNATQLKSTVTLESHHHSFRDAWIQASPAEHHRRPQDRGPPSGESGQSVRATLQVFLL